MRATVPRAVIRLRRWPETTADAPNAISPDPPRDLRRLKLRYGERMAEVFHVTVGNGRPDKGMPKWEGVLEEPVLWTIFTFLESVQTQP